MYQEVPKWFFQQELRGVVDKTTTQQRKVRQFETDRRQDLELEIFLLKFLDLVIHHSVLKLKLFSQQDLVYKTTAKTTQDSAVRVQRVPGTAGSSSSRDIC